MAFSAALAHFAELMAEPELVVRTITVGITLERGMDADAVDSQITLAADVHEAVKARLTAAGYSVQTCRVATNPFEDYLDLVSRAKAVLPRLGL